MDDLSPCPTDVRWKNELDKMRRENAPMSVKELAVSGGEIAAVEGMEKKYISAVLKELLLHAALYPKDNTKQRLLQLTPACLSSVKAEAAKTERKNEQTLPREVKS